MNSKSDNKLRWKEPAAFRRSVTRMNRSRSSVWVRPLLMLLICALGLGFLWYHGNLIANSWPVSIGAVIGVAWLATYGVSWLVSRDPNIIFVGRDGIGRQLNQGGSVRLECWRWEDISSCRVQTMELDGTSYTTLSLMGTAEELLVIGLAENIDRQVLESTIRSHGCGFEDCSQSYQSANSAP